MNGDDDDPPDQGFADLTVEDMPPRNPGTPPDFRERLALALKTTDADVLTAAEACYVGRFASAHAFILRELSEHLPEFLQWLLPCLDPVPTRAGYEGDKLLVWTILLSPDDALVFQSLRIPVGTKFMVASEAGERIPAYGGDT